MAARVVARASGSPVPKPTGCLVSGQTGLVLDGAGCVQEGEEPKLLKKIAATVAVVGVLAGLGAFGALSIFTSTADVTGNAFTTGTVVISTSPASVLITYDNMAPGDTTTQSLVVSNDGSLELRYAISSSATDTDLKGLKDQLVLTIKTIDVTLPATPCDDFDGTQLYTGDLDDGVSGYLVGDPTQGEDTGDRTLAASTSETLCFQVSLPSDTGDAFQDATTTATFSFEAEQTKNNPP